MEETSHDPYLKCDKACTHDLVRGLTLAELLGGDGPHADSYLIVTYTPAGAVQSLAEAS
ncbi:MAG: hypothetical protein HKN07_09165 [Acidimicrobiia bacterium]|nr:hypothetical protein [Acidimicrobiia bacterium]